MKAGNSTRGCGWRSSHFPHCSNHQNVTLGLGARYFEPQVNSSELKDWDPEPQGRDSTPLWDLGSHLKSNTP